VSVDLAERNVRPVFLLGLALLATFAVYSRTLNFEFVFDDEALIDNNPLIRESRFVPSYFERHLVSHVTPHQPGNYYRPVLLLWLFVNYQLFGLNPMGWHLSTLLAHLGAIVLVYFAARRLAGAAQPGSTFTGRAETLALFAALIFGLHPVHVENVAWIMGVTEPLVAIPTLASFLCYVRARQSLCDASNSNSHPKLWFAAALSLYAVALLSKETALVLPGILLAYEWFYHSGAQEPAFAGRARAILYPLLPFLLLAAAYLALRMKVLGGLSHGDASAADGEIADHPFSAVVLCAATGGSSRLECLLRQPVCRPSRSDEFCRAVAGSGCSNGRAVAVVATLGRARGRCLRCVCAAAARTSAEPVSLPDWRFRS